MLVDRVSREDRHTLISGEIVLLLEGSLQFLLTIRLFRAVHKIVFVHLLVVNGLTGVQQDYRRVINMIFVAWLLIIYF